MPHPVKSECGIESAPSKRRRQAGRRRGLKKGASPGVRVFRNVCGRIAAQATARTASRKNGTGKRNRTPERDASRRAFRTDPATGCEEDCGISFEGRVRGPACPARSPPEGQARPPGTAGMKKAGRESTGPRRDRRRRTRCGRGHKKTRNESTDSGRDRSGSVARHSRHGGSPKGQARPPGKGGVPPHPLTTPRGRSEAIFRAMPARCTTSTTLPTSLYARGASSTRVLSE